MNYVADDRVKAYKPQERKCHFPHEWQKGHKSSMFQGYTRPGCQFECHLEQIMNSAGCLPWDFPVPNPGSNGTAEVDICRGERLQNFEKLMNSDLVECECPPDCNYVQYDTQVDS